MDRHRMVKLGLLVLLTMFLMTVALAGWMAALKFWGVALVLGGFASIGVIMAKYE